LLSSIAEAQPDRGGLARALDDERRRSTRGRAEQWREVDVPVLDATAIDRHEHVAAMHAGLRRGTLCDHRAGDPSAVGGAVVRHARLDVRRAAELREQRRHRRPTERERIEVARRGGHALRRAQHSIDG
jgi:hypothetical protein